jgi:hypothetical protein
MPIKLAPSIRTAHRRIAVAMGRVPNGFGPLNSGTRNPSEGQVQSVRVRGHDKLPQVPVPAVEKFDPTIADIDGDHPTWRHRPSLCSTVQPSNG